MNGYEDGDDVNVWLKRDLVTAFCRNPRNDDYSAALQLVESAADENKNASILLARSFAQFRNGQEGDIPTIRNDVEPRGTILSMCLEAIRDWRDGEHDSAREQLAEAREFADTAIASPDGPDFKYSKRAHTWALAQVALREAQQTVTALNEEGEITD